jgi:hypothetical protein
MQVFKAELMFSTASRTTLLLTLSHGSNIGEGWAKSIEIV